MHGTISVMTIMDVKFIALVIYFVLDDALSTFDFWPRQWTNLGRVLSLMSVSVGAVSGTSVS